MTLDKKGFDLERKSPNTMWYKRDHFTLFLLLFFHYIFYLYVGQSEQVKVDQITNAEGSIFCWLQA